jgi:hypothetical protein
MAPWVGTTRRGTAISSCFLLAGSGMAAIWSSCTCVTRTSTTHCRDNRRISAAAPGSSAIVSKIIVSMKKARGVLGEEGVRAGGQMRTVLLHGPDRQHGDQARAGRFPDLFARRL